MCKWNIPNITLNSTDGNSECLNEHCAYLGHYVKPEIMYIIEITQSKHGSEESTGEHPPCQIVPDGQPLSYESTWNREGNKEKSHN